VAFKIRLNQFRPRLCHGPRWRSSQRSPGLPSRLERGHLSPYPTPLGTDPPSALAMRPPEFQPDLCLWRHMVDNLSWILVRQTLYHTQAAVRTKKTAPPAGPVFEYQAFRRTRRLLKG